MGPHQNVTFNLKTKRIPRSRSHEITGMTQMKSSAISSSLLWRHSEQIWKLKNRVAHLIKLIQKRKLRGAGEREEGLNQFCVPDELLRNIQLKFSVWIPNCWSAHCPLLSYKKSKLFPAPLPKFNNIVKQCQYKSTASWQQNMQKNYVKWNSVHKFQASVYMPHSSF